MSLKFNTSVKYLKRLEVCNIYIYDADADADDDDDDDDDDDNDDDDDEFSCREIPSFAPRILTG